MNGGRACWTWMVGVLLMSVCAWGFGLPRELPGRADNLVILCIDTIRADHMGVYGYGRDTTPTVDRLAAQGMLFERAVAQSNWTVPATASILTSLYPRQHGAVLAGEIKNLGDIPPLQLRPEVDTLGDVLKKGGFRTGLLSANPFLYGRFTRGFDVAQFSRRSGRELVDEALAFVREAGKQRFFLYLQFMDLHQPITPPEPYFTYFPAAEGGPRGPEHTDWNYGRQTDLSEPSFRRFRGHKLGLYDGALRYIDAEIGRLLANLDKSGLRERTLVIVTGDHGEEFWEHADLERQLGGDPRGLWGVGHGHSMFQELLRIPLIVQGPGVAQRTRSACVARQLDIGPTALALLGLRTPPQMLGTALASHGRTGDGAAPCQAVPAIAESPAFGPEAQAILWRDWKLVRRADGVQLLFDLRSDPGETTNLAGKLPAVAARLNGLLSHELGGRVPGTDAVATPPDEETLRQLRAVGYLDGGGP